MKYRYVLGAFYLLLSNSVILGFERSRDMASGYEYSRGWMSSICRPILMMLLLLSIGCVLPFRYACTVYVFSPPDSLSAWLYPLAISISIIYPLYSSDSTAADGQDGDCAYISWCKSGCLAKYRSIAKLPIDPDQRQEYSLALILSHSLSPYFKKYNRNPIDSMLLVSW